MSSSREGGREARFIMTGLVSSQERLLEGGVSGTQRTDAMTEQQNMN